MEYVLDILLALLAALGVGSLGWLLFGRLLTPAGRGGQVFAVLPARGDGSGLEYALAGLRWLRGAGLAHFTVVVADAGLDEQGRGVAAALAVEHPEILICPMEGLDRRLAAWAGETEWREKGGGACGGGTESCPGHCGGCHLPK